MYESTVYITGGRAIEMRPLRCKNCKKEFFPAPYHVYREQVRGVPHKYYMFCKWSCLCEFRRKKRKRIKKVDIEIPAKYQMIMDGEKLEVDNGRDFEKKVFGKSYWRNPVTSFSHFRQRLKKAGTMESYGHTFSELKKNYSCKEEFINNKYEEQ